MFTISIPKMEDVPVVLWGQEENLDVVKVSGDVTDNRNRPVFIELVTLVNRHAHMHTRIC